MFMHLVKYYERVCWRGSLVVEEHIHWHIFWAEMVLFGHQKRTSTYIGHGCMWAYKVGMWIIERLCVRQGSPDPILPTPPTNRLPASICPLRTFLFWPISNTQIQTWTQTLKIQKQKLPNKTACVPISSKFPLLPNCQNSEPNTITNSNLRTSFKNTHRLPAAFLGTIMMIRTIKIILVMILVTLITLKRWKPSWFSWWL